MTYKKKSTWSNLKVLWFMNKKARFVS